jgi:hypothetical protein
VSLIARLKDHVFRKSEPVATAHVEPLESRTLLAALTPHTYTLTLWRDDNFNGRRDRKERAVSGFAMFALVHNSSGDVVKRAALTDAAGHASVTDYVADGTNPKVRFRVPVHVKYRSTTSRTDSLPAWYGDAYIDRPNVSIGLTDLTPLSGTIKNLITFSDGFSGTTPLALRRVYDDRNSNGRYDRGEPSGKSDLEGKYTITLRSGSHLLRIQKRDGWINPADSPNTVAMRTRPTSTLPTFTVKMYKPVQIDVLAGYTSAAADGRGKITMYNFVRSLFIEANRAYANSDTNVLINLRKAILATGYTEAGDLSDDLDNLDSGAGGLSTLLAEREKSDDDLVTLLTSADLDTGDSIGIAFEYQSNDRRGDNGLSVVALQGDDSDDAITLAHELGHNLGAGHDPNADDGDKRDDAPEPYAHGYVFTGIDGRQYKDVMAYGSATTIPFFSTPLYVFDGAPIGTAATADNARIIRELAPIVSDYR